MTGDGSVSVTPQDICLFCAKPRPAVHICAHVHLSAYVHRCAHSLCECVGVMFVSRQILYEIVFFGE